VAGDIDHLGLRVAYVSGTQKHDVAGSLTYYFDEGHLLQRIALSGQTSDPARLVAIAAGQYGLAPARTLDAALYTRGDAAAPTSFLRVGHSNPSGHKGSLLEVSLDLVRSDALGTSSKPARNPVVPSRAYRRW
jgi:hypothetical protein